MLDSSLAKRWIILVLPKSIHSHTYAQTHTHTHTHTHTDTHTHLYWDRHCWNRAANKLHTLLSSSLYVNKVFQDSLRPPHQSDISFVNPDRQMSLTCPISSPASFSTVTGCFAENLQSENLPLLTLVVTVFFHLLNLLFLSHSMNYT